MAVGSTGGTALAEVWNGASWSTTSAVVLPAGGSDYLLNSISCVSTTWCLAVGQYTPGGGTPGTRAIASLWNGSSWSAVPNLAFNGVTLTPIAYGVSCVSTTLCYAVGAASGQPLVNSYNSGTWSTVPVTLPAGATGGELRGISCVSTVHCEASGWSLFGGTPTGLIETYS